MKKDVWKKIPDARVQHVWKKAEDDDCGEGPGIVTVSPSWYEDNGTPICFCGEDMVYSHTEILTPNTLLGLVADIRAAVGDPKGKLMQDELVEHCRTLAHSADWNHRRVEMLSRFQKHMRDPERTLVCDILANGQLMPDPLGKRYGFESTGNEHHCRPNTNLSGA